MFELEGLDPGTKVEIRFAYPFGEEGDKAPWLPGTVAGNITPFYMEYGVEPYEFWVPVHPENSMSIFLVPKTSLHIRRRTDD